MCWTHHAVKSTEEEGPEEREFNSLEMTVSGDEIAFERKWKEGVSASPPRGYEGLLALLVDRFFSCNEGTFLIRVSPSLFRDDEAYILGRYQSMFWAIVRAQLHVWRHPHAEAVAFERTDRPAFTYRNFPGKQPKTRKPSIVDRVVRWFGIQKADV